MQPITYIRYITTEHAQLVCYESYKLSIHHIRCLYQNQCLNDQVRMIILTVCVQLHLTDHKLYNIMVCKHSQFTGKYTFYGKQYYLVLQENCIYGFLPSMVFIKLRNNNTEILKYLRVNKKLNRQLCDIYIGCCHY